MNKSEILENIRNGVGRENIFNGNSFKRGRCSADLTGVSEDARIVVDLDKVFPSGQMGNNQCECVLFYFDTAANFVVVPIELKGGEVDTSEVVQQLRGGAAFAARYAPNTAKICRPVLFHNGIRAAEVKELNTSRSKVTFAGNSFEIKTTRCGGKLANVLP